MAASDVMERCSSGEMWFESQPLNWKIRKRTKALNGGYQTRLRPLMCWSLLLHSLGTREQNIGGFSEAQEAPGWLLVWSGGSFFFPQNHREITGSILSQHGTSVDTPVKTVSESKHPPPSISLLHSKLSFEEFLRKVGSLISQPWFQFVSQKLQSTEPLRCVVIFFKVCLCHWTRRNHQYSFLDLSLCVSCFSVLLYCPLLSENIHRAYSQGILIISGGVSSVGRRPSIPLMYDQSKKIQPLIYLDMERMGENDLVLRRQCFHSNILTEAESTYTLLSKYTSGSAPCPMILTLCSSFMFLCILD